jgi:DNA-binding transcriptional regulator YbjK
MIAFGQEWWDKLEPQLYDVLCNKNNEQHDDLVAALQDGVRMLAATLAPALVAQVAALPAIAVVVATIAAKKIAETGLEAVCGLWADSMANQPEDEQVP